MNVALDSCIELTNKYIAEHIDLGNKWKRPVVIEEFGIPRDGRSYQLDAKTDCRNKYLENVFAQVLHNSKTSGILAGCNFWAWGGFGRATSGHVYWQRGDAYLGDPAQEEQGLNSVFDVDTTIPLIVEYTSQINRK